MLSLLSFFDAVYLLYNQNWSLLLSSLSSSYPCAQASNRAGKLFTDLTCFLLCTDFTLPLIECFNYRFLTEFNRARSYTSGYLCDNSLPFGWYRFSGAAGNQMADSCVAGYRCGTRYPGWLDGSHPSVTDGAVQRRVCFGWRSTVCCFWSTYISVRNCGGFYVYQLRPVTRCYLRYCGNGVLPPLPVAPGRKFLELHLITR